jgi:hypothetical protein
MPPFPPFFRTGYDQPFLLSLIPEHLATWHRPRFGCSDIESLGAGPRLLLARTPDGHLAHGKSANARTGDLVHRPSAKAAAPGHCGQEQHRVSLVFSKPPSLSMPVPCSCSHGYPANQMISRLIRRRH